MFGFPGSITTRAWDISATGLVVGWHRNSAGIHGFLLRGGVFTSIDVPGATSTLAFGVDAPGRIVGYFTDATGAHGFLRVEKD